MASAELPPPTGRLVIISGPSGAGKSTVLARLIEVCQLPLEVSVSATTRPARPGEIDGQSYHFLAPEVFASCREEDKFLECKEVFGRGYWYGTLREPVTTGLKAGKWVILEIDVEGALDVLAEVPDTITIFVHPGSMAELERRLRKRGTETPEAMAVRLRQADREMSLAPRYRHCVVNHDVNEAVDEICNILGHYGE